MNTLIQPPQEKTASQPALLAAKVFINTPWPYRTAIIGITLLSLAAGLFILTASFAEKWTVQGFLNAKQGTLHLYPPQQGFITQRLIQVGDSVKKGQLLYTLNTTWHERTTQTTASIKQTLLQQHRLVLQAIAHKKALLQSWQPLLQKKYIEQVAYDTQKDALLQLEQQKNQLKLALIEDAHHQGYTLRAPIDGVIANLNGQVGQWVSLDKPLASLLPVPTQLIVQLYIPVKQAPFIQPNQTVLLRYEGYPDIPWSTSQAFISQQSLNVLTDAEDTPKPLTIHEPYYKAIATLEQPFIMVNGKKQWLKQGMTLTAMILGQKKTLWHWLFDPIHHLAEGVVS